MGWRNNRWAQRASFSPKAEATEIPETERIKNLIPSASHWGKTFLESILSQIEAGRKLSVAQVETFKKLEKETISGKEDQETFAKNFTEDMREKYRVACEYYSGTVYYGIAISLYRTEQRNGTFSSFIPSAKSYASLVENKYFAKVLAAYRAAPRFHCGDLAIMKSYLLSAPGRTANVNVSGGEAVLVLRVDPIVPASAAVGAKVYLVRCLSGGKERYAEERNLKTLKGVK